MTMRLQGKAAIGTDVAQEVDGGRCV